MIMLIPTVYTYVTTGKISVVLLVDFVLNWVIHCCVDAQKANKKKINLVQDQLIHFIQIIGTWLMFITPR